MGCPVPAYQDLGLDRVLDGDVVLRDLVLARIIEPTSKLDAARVLTGVWVPQKKWTRLACFRGDFQ